MNSQKLKSILFNFDIVWQHLELNRGCCRTQFLQILSNREFMNFCVLQIHNSDFGQFYNTHSEISY